MSIRPTRRSLAFVLATVALAAPGLTGCGFDAATERPYTPAAGANDVSGVVDVLGAVVVSSAPGSGTFVATLANNDQQDPDVLDADRDRADREASSTRSRSRGAARSTSPTTGASSSAGTSPPGTSSPSTIGFDSGERVTMQVPVVPNSGNYEGLDGEPSESRATSRPPTRPRSGHARPLDDPGPAPPRRERVERQEPLHRLGRRRPHREGPRRGGPRRRAWSARPGCCPTSSTPRCSGVPSHRQPRPRRGRPALDPGAPLLAAQRAPLRRPPGQGQEADARGVRRGAVHALAAQLRHAAAAARRRRRVLPGRRPALRRPRRRDAAHRVPQGRRRPDAPVLGATASSPTCAPAGRCWSPRTATACAPS